MTVDEAEKLAPEKLAEVIAAEVKAKRAELVEALAQSKNKAVARAAKKALYQLKSTGVAVTQPAPVAAAPAAPAHDGEHAEELPSLMSSILGTGERALFFVKPVRGGGLDMYQAIVHDEQGIQQLDHGETNRANYRKHLKEVRADAHAVIEVSLARVVEELGIAWAANGRSKHPLTPEAESQLRRLGVTQLEQWPALPAPEPADAGLTVRAGSLHDEVELVPWLPSAKDIAVLSQRLDEVDTSVLQLSELQKREQRIQKVQHTAAEVSAESRRVYAYRLWRMAEVFELTKRPEQGRIARAEARLLFHDVKAPSRFIERMFEKVLMLAEQARARQAGAKAEGGPPPPPEKRSSGGLIMP
jgi:hypothetical protein